ncbi:hypothetical protein AAHE18_08G079200 [Arachis hypogaea]
MQSPTLNHSPQLYFKCCTVPKSNIYPAIQCLWSYLINSLYPTMPGLLTEVLFELIFIHPERGGLHFMWHSTLLLKFYSRVCFLKASWMLWTNGIMDRSP